MLAGRRADKPEVQKVAKDLGKAVKRNPKGEVSSFISKSTQRPNSK